MRDLAPKLQGSGLPPRVYAYSVNRELVRRGFARLCYDWDEKHRRAMRDTPAYSRLVNQLQVCTRTLRNRVFQRKKSSCRG